MRKFLACAFLAASAVVALAQDSKPIRLKIRHADPWMVKAMLEGAQVRFPELGTLLGLGGPNPFTGQTGTPLFPDGTFMVNPTDNSLWFVPTPRRAN